MMIKKICWLLFGCALAIALPARTMVLPFRVDSQNHVSTQWLGKAVSFYMLAGLEQNSLAILSEEETQFILDRNNIHFPYNITKATALALAQENRADTLVWGKVLYNKSDATVVTINAEVIDIANRHQKHLPLIKGRFKDIYQIQQELLKDVIRALGVTASGVRYPELNIKLSDYEKLVKSLLVDDGDKKTELLQSINNGGAPSDYVNFELAKMLLRRGDWTGVDDALARLSDSAIFRARKNFLSALSCFAKGDTNQALNGFVQLQQEDRFAVATNNNLGVIYMAKNNYPLAEKCFQYALFLQKDPEIFANYVQLLDVMDNPERAVAELNRALLFFPEDQRLIKRFFAFLSTQENRDLLEPFFRSYLLAPMAPTDTAETDEFEPLLKNPFWIKSIPVLASDHLAIFNDAIALLRDGDEAGAQEKFEQAMELNPFFADCHQRLAALYLKKKQPEKAEKYLLGSLYLRETPEAFQQLVDFYRALKATEKMRLVLATAREKFPGNRAFAADGQ